MSYNSPDNFYMEDGNKYISFSMNYSPGEKVARNKQEQNVHVKDDDLVETSFAQNDEGGWGFGEGGCVTRGDIRAMADCIRSVIYNNEMYNQYSCMNNVFRIEISYDCNTDRYTFTGALMEMLCWQYQITITKTDLTRAALDEYINPIFIWEKEYPVGKRN